MKQIPDDIIALRRAWYRCYALWTTAHYIVGGGAAVGAVLVATHPDALRAYTTSLTVAVAVCTTTATFFQTGAKASAYITAWRYLGKACNNFRTDETFTEAKLREASDVAENDIIAKGGI